MLDTTMLSPNTSMDPEQVLGVSCGYFKSLTGLGRRVGYVLVGHEISAHGNRWLDSWDYGLSEDFEYVKANLLS